MAIVSAVALAVSAAGTAGASTRSLGSPPPIRFAPTRSYRTGPSPQQVAFADFDGDGTVDLVTANQGGRTVSLLRGRGDGTFRRARQIRAGIPRPLAIATADMNGDGHADLVIVNGLRPNRVAVLLGNGSGGFTRSRFPGGHRSQWVIAVDLNGDGVPDVATANAGGGVSVLLGEGDGSLEPAVDHATKSTMCSSLTAADLNEDGIPDLVTTNSVLGNGASNHSISVLLGEPGGGFGSAVVYRHLGYQPTMATTADLNGDGHLDVIAPMGGWPGHYVTVLFGSGNGTLHDPVLLNAGPSAHDTVAVDLNGDGHVDLASSGLGTSYVVPTNQGIGIRPGRGDGTFSPIVRITDAWPSTTWRWPTSIGAADLNGDGRIDLIAPDERNDTVGVLLNRS
ncbi:MAG TPA: VCBS repeat-containing protein [Actinomycetota bacterium]|nr:VCBS repeat-containing protein [Actinomycetota bacterium]